MKIQPDLAKLQPILCARSKIASADYYIKKREKQQELVAEFNKAVEYFNEGNAFSKRRKWNKAVESYEEAVYIWEKLSREKSEVGKRAKDRVPRAIEAAAYAKKYEDSL